MELESQILPHQDTIYWRLPIEVTSDILDKDKDKNKDFDSPINNPEPCTNPQRPQAESSYPAYWRCWKIENLQPCDCKTATDCLMYSLVRKWKDADELIVN